MPTMKSTLRHTTTVRSRILSILAISLLVALLFQPTSCQAVDISAATNTCDNDSQCRNGGVCAEPNDKHSHRYCHCAVGYAGVRCNSFCPLECQNGGYCRFEHTSEPIQYKGDRDPNDYICQCFGLFEGRNCEIPYMNCGDGRRCYNGGVCRLQVDKEGQPSSTCDCPTGIGGETCQARQQQQNVIPQITSPPRLEHDEGSRGNKAARTWGILFISIFCAYCCWYAIKKIRRHKDVSDVEVELQHGVDYDDKSEASVESYEDIPRWRNVV